jgi:hypothetical protein
LSVPKRPPPLKARRPTSRLDMINIFLTALILGLCLPGGVRADEVIIGGFSRLDPSRGLPDPWEQMVFPKISRHTAYQLIRDGRKTVVQAVSAAAASGLMNTYHAPAERHPWISWQWKIAHVLESGDVATKKGDDYAARIYVAFKYSPAGMSWLQKMQYHAARLVAGDKLPGSAINYIWANKAPVGTIVANPYTDQTRMIVVQSGNASAGRWIAEKRNLVRDYQAAFGKKPPPIMGIAIMTDTDNTGESTTAWYGDIILSDTDHRAPIQKWTGTN